MRPVMRWFSQPLSLPPTELQRKSLPGTKIPPGSGNAPTGRCDASRRLSGDRRRTTLSHPIFRLLNLFGLA
ncbi:hypothetical protein ACVWW1_005962 [Bradyrhizobium sp. JR3.5]